MAPSSTAFSSFRQAAILSLSFCGLNGCSTGPVASSCPMVTTEVSADGAWPRSKVDILFVIDNTPSMVGKQQALASAFPDLLRALDGSGNVDYHIGFATTDVGSWVAADQPWTMTSGACDSYAGDDGALQSDSCLDRQRSSSASAQVCTQACPDRRFVPTDGTGFLSGYRGFHNVPTALEIDPMTGKPIDRGPEYALRCMGIVGDGGCGLVSPLEAMKRALDGHRPENHGFLRSNAVLRVFIVTDKDDCSVQGSRRIENDPRTRSCTTPDLDAAADCFDPAFRCLARNLRCAEPLNIAGTKSACTERTDSYLEPVQSYVNFLRTLKPANNFSVHGLWPLPSVSRGGQVVVVQDPKVAGSAGLRPAGGAQASCQSTSDPKFVGQPQVRLDHLMSLFSTPWYQPDPGNICEPQRYSATLVGQFPSRDICRLRLIGLTSSPLRNAEGTPTCVVGDVSDATPHATPEREMPLCASPCCDAMENSQPRCGSWSDAVVSACASAQQPCYCIVRPDPTEAWGGKARFGVWRPRNAEGPSGTVVSIRCASHDGASCALPFGTR